MRHHHEQHGHHFSHHGHDRHSDHLAQHAMGRHEGGRGGRNGFGGDFGGEGGGDGFNRSRKFSSQDLQLLLLALLADKPAHGYELIKALEARSNGFYTPSPGMVYPALTYMEELGHVTVTLDGNRKCYALADEGKEYLAANQERVDMMLARITHIARKMDSIRRAYSGEAGAEVADENNGWLPELVEARRALKSALLQRSDAPATEQRRIAAVLVQAAREISGE
ncbi:PadR family transcriptional regulator [Solimicrobium silvestre]|uniref:Transcriptional regulator PadR-like family n=1 Tax=Solimicrobium silvestre TaxID=2099400 RepID=A0A2S9H5H8_9BURK|nr:PadR family transcriptional regulator [Solimicrobium silvestre]PRC95126.1 Transcriptional regulator PadR-like family [Solimicrobium silvestre]